MAINFHNQSLAVSFPAFACFSTMLRFVWPLYIYKYIHGQYNFYLFMHIVLRMFPQSTRVQWTPPLRESFGYPFILAQMLAVTQCLSQKTMPRWKHLFLVFLTTTCALVTWQFSQFVFLTQVIALSFIWVLNSNKTCRSSLGIIFLGKLVIFTWFFKSFKSISIICLCRLDYKTLFCSCLPMKCCLLLFIRACCLLSCVSYCLYNHFHLIRPAYGPEWSILCYMQSEWY